MKDKTFYFILFTIIAIGILTFIGLWIATYILREHASIITVISRY